MFCKTTAEIRTAKGKIAGGEVVDISKYLKKSEIDTLVKKGYLILIEESKEEEITKTLDDLLELSPSNLKKSELIEVCEHYKLPVDGHVGDLRERIETFQKLLDSDDLSELSDGELAQLANYADIELGEERESDIATLEELLRL